MIEKVILDYLKNALSEIVCTEMPDDITGEFVLIEKTGSSKKNMVCSATFAIQSYAESLYDAASLNEKVKLAMEGDGSTTFGILALSEISKCELYSDYNYPDKTYKKNRYQAVYYLVYQI